MKPDSILIQHFESALRHSIGSMTGKEYRATPRSSSDDDANTPNLEQPIIWQQAFSCAPGPSFWIAAGKDLWEAVGRATLEAAGITEVSDEDCRSTWHEILSQTAGAMASAMTIDQGREVSVSHGAELDSEPASSLWYFFTITDDNGNSGLLKTAWTDELENAGARQLEEAHPAKSRDTSVSKTFDLLLDVALPVAVSFGKTSLQIKEVLKLNTGSIVELDRFVTDPVEVIVNNCVIARGEVVVVDGNYGVRINQLASREERLRSGMVETGHKGIRV